MNLSQRAERTATQICGAFGVSPTAEQSSAVRSILERAFIDVVLVEQERCARVAKKCCAEDRDLAHKLADAILEEKSALIANLSAMR